MTRMPISCPAPSSKLSSATRRIPARVKSARSPKKSSSCRLGDLPRQNEGQILIVHRLPSLTEKTVMTSDTIIQLN